MHTVLIDGSVFPLEEVQEHPARYLRRLEQAKVTPGYAICQCDTGADPLRLVIRRYGTLCHLAGWPDDGHRHKRSCPFYKRVDGHGASGRAGDPADAILVRHDGMNVRLDVSLIARGTAEADGPTSRQSHASAGRRSSRLLAFLQRWWLEAGLARWSATSASRHWGVCSAQLLAALGDGTINGHDAQSVLHVMRRYQETERSSINTEFDRYLSRLTFDAQRPRRGLVVGEFSELAATPWGHAITLRQNPRRYYLSGTLAAHAEKSYPHAWRAIGDGVARVVAILVVERTAKSHLRVVDLAAMLCSQAYIPCDSIHEVAMANRLVREGRTFEKPMRLAAGDDMLPDFVLTDTPMPVHIEVYGMNGMPAYEQRKSEKRALRRERGIRAVEWDVGSIPVDRVALPATTQPAHR